MTPMSAKAIAFRFLRSFLLTAIALIFLFVLPLAQSARAGGVSWSSLTLSEFRDSYGHLLDETFHVQLGFFESALTGGPTVDNVADWVNHWKVFDEASINLNDTGSDYFTSEAWVGADGQSYVNSGGAPVLNPDADLGLNFAGQEAYIWLYNSKTPSLTTEWFLARVSDWILPAGSDDCCDPTFNLQWNVSQLATNEITPVWGAQSGKLGNGYYTDTTPGAYELQTFTFIPEPSSLLMAVIGSSLLLRRRRDQVNLSA
jgi:hypothetical protein